MGDTHRDPTDHFRTTDPHAGESLIDVYCWPGLVLMAVGVIALTGAVAAAAYKHQEWIPTTAVIAAIGIAVGALWVCVEHRRVRRIEMRWWAEHSGMALDSHPRCL